MQKLRALITGICGDDLEIIVRTYDLKERWITMEDWEISANKAEEIYEKKQELKDLKNYIIKLDVKRTMYADDPQKFEGFEARY